jgi:hypothetical protein
MKKNDFCPYKLIFNRVRVRVRILEDMVSKDYLQEDTCIFRGELQQTGVSIS